MLQFNSIIRAIGGEITSDGDFLIFEGNRYSRKGFLYKNFLMSAILSEGVKPTLAELERFEEQPEGNYFSSIVCIYYGHFKIKMLNFFFSCRNQY